MSEWQPIETAKKDGSKVIVWPPISRGDISLACYCHGFWDHRGYDGNPCWSPPTPTHWRPIPGALLTGPRGETP